MPRKRKRKRPFRPLVQLAFCFPKAAPLPVDKEQEIENFTLGYFVGRKMSTGRWFLTVARDMRPGEQLTPERWWQEEAVSDFTLLGWDPEHQNIVSERDEGYAPPAPLKTRSVATRWLRAFNESFQLWRMRNWR